MGIDLCAPVLGLHLVPYSHGGADTRAGPEHDARLATVLAYPEGLPDLELHSCGGGTEE